MHLDTGAGGFGGNGTNNTIIMTSPSVYLAVQNLAATQWNEYKIQTSWTMTYATRNFVVSMAPEDLSTIVRLSVEVKTLSQLEVSTTFIWR